tara:strand:- start:2124 stop:2231 length:108 start_codon:yes stop_codon:yes gene_type:complete
VHNKIIKQAINIFVLKKYISVVPKDTACACPDGMA